MSGVMPPRNAVCWNPGLLHYLRYDFMMAAVAFMRSKTGSFQLLKSHLICKVCAIIFAASEVRYGARQCKVLRNYQYAPDNLAYVSYVTEFGGGWA